MSAFEDAHVQEGYTVFMSTFTCVDTFCEEFEEKLASWHARKCDSVLLVREGADGSDTHLHYHSVAAFKNKQAAGVSRQAETFYKKLGMEWDKRRSVVVKKVCDLFGALHYLMKAQPAGRAPLMVKGWKLSWIKEMSLKSLKKMPHAQLLKDQYILSPKTATNMILEFANRKGLPITGRESFRGVIKEMIADHYRVSSIWPKITIIYAEVLMECGNHSGFDQVFDNAFFNIN